MSGLVRAARADLTVDSLTSTAISGVGPYYQDVSDAIRLFGVEDYTNALARLERAQKTVPRLAPAEVMMACSISTPINRRRRSRCWKKSSKNFPRIEAYVMLAERAVSEGR